MQGLEPGGELRQLHLSAAWTSHNNARFRLRGRTLELTAAGFSTGIEGGSCPGARPGGHPPCEQVRILNSLIIICFLVCSPHKPLF